MKQYCRWFFTLLVVLSLSAGVLSVSVFAAEGTTVLTIKDLQGNFQVSPGSQESQSDLFSSFKDVMPGDVCGETIEIRNRTGEQKPIRLTLTSISPIIESTEPEQRAAMEELLAMLSVRVWAENTLVFDATAATSFDKPVPLGMIPYGKSADMRVELTVPVEVNNRQAGNIAQIQWVFGAEDASDLSAEQTGVNLSAPQTGDNSHLVMWSILFVVSLCGMVGVSFWNRKRNR